MSRTRKVELAVALVVAIVAVAGAGLAASSGSSSKKRDLVVLADAQRRTLQEKVTLTGTLAREEQRKITSVGQARVSAVAVDDGATVNAGSALVALDGRMAIAQEGDVRFFRPLDVGDRGDDVRQLEEILASSGHSPGAIDNRYTEQTRFALAQWQAEHGYPGATPEKPQTVTVTLQSSGGATGGSYTVGKRASAGLVIGPATGAAAAVAREAAGAARVVLAALRPTAVGVLALPTLTIQSKSAVVNEGGVATFVISTSAASGAPIDVPITVGGTIDGADVVTPPATVTLPADATSVELAIATRADRTVERDETLTVTLGTGAGFVRGTPRSASTTIIDDDVPELRLSGGGTVAEGATATITVTADQPPVRDTQVVFQVGGDATAGRDYSAVNPAVTLAAGRTTATLPIRTLADTTIEPDRHIVVSLAPSGGYRAGMPATAVVTIAGASGDAARPVVTITSATATLQKGQPYTVAVGLSAAMSSDLTIALSYGGTAVPGVDYTPPAGAILVPPGQTALTVTIPTVVDKVVQADRRLTVALAPSADYRIGEPAATAVTIMSQVVPELTITASTSALAVGGAAAFTIHADQAPVEDTTVGYQVVGSAQPGADYEPLLGVAVLPAGQREVTVTLRSIAKDVVFQPTDMIVGHWPIRVGQVFVDEGDSVPPGTPLLSLTDPDFTVTLKASASDRTKLQVGQRCTVKLTGGDTEVDGTISELDENVTIDDKTKEQSYAGKISVGDLGAADGAAVTINVVTKERTDALTVPIAAVKQDGTGRDVVRVLDLGRGGKVREVPVETGLTEGSFIEIVKGLRGDETVIVEVDKS